MGETFAHLNLGGVSCVRCPLCGWIVDSAVRVMGGAWGHCSRLSVCCLDDQELDDVFPYIENAYEGITKEKQCEGIYD